MNPAISQLNTAGEAWTGLMLAVLWQSTLLAVVIAMAALAARRSSPAVRYWLFQILAIKLLVMMDGRTLYSPLFSGVFWDAQEFVPADIERIEVVSGPAGPTWGTNAVNGVINVVTKSSADTQGPSLSTTLGNFERSAVARHGFALGDGSTARVWAKTFTRDATLLRQFASRNREALVARIDRPASR